MTESEAIKEIKKLYPKKCKMVDGRLKGGFDDHESKGGVAIDMAIQALEKQIPKKPITHSNTNRADCPCCGATVRGIKNQFGDWCSNCGQKLDFGE